MTPWTVACQASLSTGFSRQEHQYGLPFPSPGDLPHSGIEPRSPALQADSLSFEPQGKPYICVCVCVCVCMYVCVTILEEQNLGLNTDLQNEKTYID